MADSENTITYESATPTVLILFFCLVGLILLLVFFYKKLNREADGQYTVRRMVYKEGGVRDRVRGAALALGTRLGVQLWPPSESDEDGEEMQEVRDVEGQVEECGSRGSDGEGDEEEEEEEEEEDSAEQCGEVKGKGGHTSDDNSSLEGSEGSKGSKGSEGSKEQARLTDQAEAKGETEEKGGDEEGEASRGAGLSLDLKQFSGSAIWSEEDGGENKDITAL